MSIVDLRNINPFLASKLEQSLPREVKIELTADDFKRMIVESAPPERRESMNNSINVVIQDSKIIINIRVI
jgi:hypothetical protein